MSLIQYLYIFIQNLQNINNFYFQFITSLKNFEIIQNQKQNRKYIIFKRLTLITPPKHFLIQQNDKIPQNLTQQCVKIISDTLKQQTTYQILNQIENLINQNPKVAELYFFYSEVNLALLNYENAYEVLQEGLKARAEPQELLRDGITVFQSIEKILNPDIKINPIILRKAPHDFYKENYVMNEKLMDELMLLGQFKVGGSLIFEKSQTNKNLNLNSENK